MRNCRLSPFLLFSIILDAAKSNTATNKQHNVLLLAQTEERKRFFRSMLKGEWKKLLSNRLMLVVVLAVIAIPTIYTTLFLGSMWDPYGSVENLPVALVNQDQPVEYEGKTLNVGGQLVENLQEDASLDFRLTDADDAAQGLADGTYYMVITIPQDFSSNAATLTDEQPREMELEYETNPGTNYIASKLSETAMKEIQAGVREEVTKTYAGRRRSPGG